MGSGRTRREVIGLGLGGAAALGLGAYFWSDVFESAEQGRLSDGRGYGPLGPADANGFRLPSGFRSRLVARGDDPVTGTRYRWHLSSDGAATFGTRDGGWILVSNSETPEGGASAIRFRRDGSVGDAYRILSGTRLNCSGGATPWGTWLSCEEVEDGHVWECDPTGRRRAVRRSALGTFKHEAAAVDPQGRRVYLTEDLIDGRLYRFTPSRWPHLSSGRLEVARVDRTGLVSWVEVPDPSGARAPTRRQVPGTHVFRRAEGIHFDGGVVYVATTADNRLHAYDVRRGRIEVIYDASRAARPPILQPDQMTVSPGRELFVCEDPDTEEIDMGVVDRGGRLSRFLSTAGPEHRGSELTGATFDPSGRRMYVASQRARERGAVYEISGPFRR